MPVVLVHGTPETPAIWEDLIPRLDADEVIALAPPALVRPYQTASAPPRQSRARGSRANYRRLLARSTWLVTTGAASTLPAWSTLIPSWCGPG